MPKKTQQNKTYLCIRGRKESRRAACNRWKVLALSGQHWEWDSYKDGGDANTKQIVAMQRIYFVPMYRRRTVQLRVERLTAPLGDKREAVSPVVICSAVSPTRIQSSVENKLYTLLPSTTSMMRLAAAAKLPAVFPHVSLFKPPLRIPAPLPSTPFSFLSTSIPNNTINSPNPISTQMINYALSLARSQRSDDSYGQAMLVLEQCHSTQFDDDSKGSVLLAMSSLLYERGKFVEAIEKLQGIQDLSFSNIGIRVAATEALVGVNLELDKIDSASVLAEKCYQIMETTTLEVDKDDLKAHIVRSLALKGLVNLVKGELESVQSNFHGFQDHDVCSGNAALSYAEYLHGIRKFSNAKSLYQKLIQDIKEDKGFQDLHIAACNMSKDEVLLASLCGLGQLEAHTGNFDDAEEILTAALKNAEECFGSQHRKVGVVLTCLALMFRLKTTMEQASSILLQEGLYRKAMELLKMPHFGTEEGKICMHDVTALARGGYGEILRLQEKRKEEGMRMKGSAEALWKNRRLSLAEALDVTTTAESSRRLPVVDARTCTVL